MDENEIVPNMMADLYRRIEHNEITREELSKNVFIIGVPNLELLSYAALKKGNKEVYQTIVFACNDAISKVDENKKK